VTLRGLAIRAVLLALCLPLCLAPTCSASDLQLVNEFGGGQFTANVNDIEVAPGGNLVLADGSSQQIQTFTPAGTPVGAFGSSGTGPGQFFNPTGLAIQGDGTIFVEDSGHGRVEVFNPAGTFLRQFATPVDFYADTAFDPAETLVYLLDYQSGNIQRMSTGGANLGIFGSLGTGDGQFERPLGIAVDPSGNIYVADRDNNRVEKLSPSGAFLANIGSAGSAPGQMRGPVDVTVEAGGNILVADTGNFRVQEFTPAGQFIASYERVAGSPSTTFSPWAVAAAPDGDLYVFDRQGAAQPRIMRVRIGAAPPPPPVLGRSVNAAPVSGTVLVREKGTAQFHQLTAGESIPVGSTLDTTKGTVRLFAATNGSGRTQHGDFSRGLFNVSQGRKNPLTTLSMTGGGLASCGKLPPGGSPKLAAARKRKRRSLFSSVKGRFSVRGRNSAATVRGTRFTMTDSCAGTRTRVRTGIVRVRDFWLRKTVTVKAGHSYLARRGNR
jgi:DNA-binding beta-propeller fold protein YncE